jgi:hypothetical protein
MKQGKAVETESCGGTSRIDFQEAWNAEGWECRHGTTLAAARPEVTAQIGVQCRCGCIIDFQDTVLNKILAANTQACPGRSFWLLQVEFRAHKMLLFFRIKSMHLFTEMREHVCHFLKIHDESRNITIFSSIILKHLVNILPFDVDRPKRIT